MRERGTPFRRIILLEPTLFDLDIEEEFIVLEKRVRVANQKRPRVWSTVDDAMEYYSERLPWKLWHPEVLQLMSVGSLLSLLTLEIIEDILAIEIDLSSCTGRWGDPEDNIRTRKRMF